MVVTLLLKRWKLSQQVSNVTIIYTYQIKTTSVFMLTLWSVRVRLQVLLVFEPGLNPHGIRVLIIASVQTLTM